MPEPSFREQQFSEAASVRTLVAASRLGATWEDSIVTDHGQRIITNHERMHVECCQHSRRGNPTVEQRRTLHVPIPGNSPGIECLIHVHGFSTENPIFGHNSPTETVRIADCTSL